MFTYRLAVLSPWYLLLLALIPALWWYSFRKVAGLGGVRRMLVLIIRSLVLLGLILALAEIQIVRTSDRLTTIFLLDQSLSIPVQSREAMIKYVNAEIRKHRKDRDRVGAIVFGRDAAIEIPPYDDNVQMSSKIESIFDPEYTNIAAAMKLAQASFPEDAAKRIVIISDGNQNLGNAVEQAQGLAQAGVGIDVMPVRYQTRAEIIVERVAIPADVRRGQPFDLRVLITNTAAPRPGDTGEVRGRLQLTRSAAGRTDILSDEAVILPPGKKVFTIRQEIDQPNFYSYEARFIPDRPEDDAMPQNNRATAFTYVQGKGRVLFIEDAERPGEFAVLVERLRKQGLEIDVQSTSQLFTSLAELQPYDAVVLADVPRATSQDVAFSDAQIAMLVRNTQQMGAGLILIGGPNSFGAGGWTGTELEKAMPVDFQIKSAKVVPNGALVMIMHASEMANGNYWQKVIAREAVKALGPQDYCGVIHWQGRETWLWGPGLLPVGQFRDQMFTRLDRMMPGDMPDFEPTMTLAKQGFDKVPTLAVKHMIIISDGDPSPPSSSIINKLKAMQVTITTVGVGTHGQPESSRLSSIASASGGKYYEVKSANSLPKIFQIEARRVARPLIWEVHPVNPRVRFPHEILSGIDDPLPPIKGFVLTDKKENPLVETLLTSPEPAGDKNNTILATWTYGLGKAVVFTSDAGARWTGDWVNSQLYDKLFGQMVRWSMRPAGGSGKFTVATNCTDGRVRMVINALDKNDEFLNFLNMNGTAVGPDMQPVPMKIEQSAPGRYVGEFAAKDAGSYFVMISPGAGQSPIRTGINVPYSDEFRELSPNDALLDQLAGMTPKDGKPGLIIEPKTKADTLEQLLAVNTFRHNLLKARSSQDAWQYLLLFASCLFFGDVFFRRVQVNVAWVPPLAGRARDWLLRRQPKPAAPEFIQRLRGKKAEVTEQIEQRRVAVRFEMPQAQKPADLTVLEEPPGADKPSKPAEKPSITEPQKTEAESYTERLLRAKKKVWEDRDKK
ncbi:MAG: VWA domain-containing protein [Thermoguttaceae bacterium]